MHDILDERLARLGGDLEDAAEIRSPALARTRGEQFRVAHRRRMVAMTTATAAVAVIGVGSLVTFRGGGQDQPVSPGTTVSSSAPSASSPTAPPAVAGQPTAVVDLSQHKMTVYDKDHKVLKTILVTAGNAKHPSRPGTFAVTTKNDHVRIDSVSAVSADNYSITVDWAIWLDGEGPLLFGAPWNESKFGKINGSHGAIEVSSGDAQWLYDYLAIGDRIQIK